jgi:hypothetical protein
MPTCDDLPETLARCSTWDVELNHQYDGCDLFNSHDSIWLDEYLDVDCDSVEPDAASVEHEIDPSDEWWECEAVSRDILVIPRHAECWSYLERRYVAIVDASKVTL